MFSQILSVFFDPIIWGGALLIGIIVTLIESKRVLKDTINPYLSLGWMQPGVTASTHGLTHKGGNSGYYFNLDYLSTRPYEVTRLVKWYADEINDLRSKTNIDGIAFIEKDSGPVGAIAIMGTIVAETGIPAIVVRLKKRISFAKVTGDREVIEKMSSGLNFVIVTDMFTTKRTVKDTIDVINEFGGKVVGVCAMLDRLGEGMNLDESITVLTYATEGDLVDGGLINTEKGT